MGKYHVRLTSCTYTLRLGCFESRENVLQAEKQMITNQEILDGQEVNQLVILSLKH